MIAYFVHNDKKDEDNIVIPDMGCSVSVTPERFEEFISVSPMFDKWRGTACGDVKPEQFGKVVASRQEGGDVYIMKEGLWRDRMEFYSGGGKK